MGLGAALSLVILYFLFRNEKGTLPETEKTVVTDYVPTVLIVGMIALLVVASFIPNTPDITNGTICVTLFVIGGIYNSVRKKSLDGIVNPLKEIDFGTIFLLFGLFIVIGGITEQGVIDALAGIFANIGGDSVFLIYTLIVWASVLFSAFIDNIPYVATMLPVVQGIAAAMGVDPTVLYFGLLSGATLGGNMTPIGASANITGIGILRKNGYEVKNSDFFRIGIPFTLAAVIPAYIYIWVVYGM